MAAARFEGDRVWMKCACGAVGEATEAESEVIEAEIVREIDRAFAWAQKYHRRVWRYNASRRVWRRSRIRGEDYDAVLAQKFCERMMKLEERYGRGPVTRAAYVWLGE